jgi:predicted nucleic acid-binding protein
MLVVDTSVAVKWVVPENGENIEDDTGLSLDLLGYPLIAPDCIVGEFANAMFRKVQAMEIGVEQAKASIDILPDLITLLPARAFIGAAFDLALSIQHPLHDCLFLVVAMQYDHELVTTDKKFVDRCRRSDIAYPVSALSERAAP